MYDITELKRQRLAMVASRERFLAVLNGLETGICVSSGEDFGLLYGNPAFARLWPLAAAGSHCVVLPGLPPQPGGEGLHIEHGPDAGGHCFELQHSRIEWSDGEQAWLTLLLDVTETRARDERERALEERFQTTTRLVAMGEMASSLAHELGQPLTAINTYASGLKRRLAGIDSLPDGVTPALQALSDQARRAGQIVSSIRAFVKKHTPQLQPVDPAVLMVHALSLAQPLADKHLVPLRLIQRGPACALQLDPVLIEQVILNLVKNAVEAQVEARVTRPRVDVRAETGLSSWRVEVLDNGPGLSDSARANLFTPFYSSKADGMGIGLNICRSIIEFHRGEFGVTRTLAGGCVFWFTLPLPGCDNAPPGEEQGRAFQA
ncbi:sensor histidine kinase, partial [Craterilacuibacter sp.]|uniref:sensor histidine kinase n=1 Tax=Craterilacuibacter sp. TaxID=2870909 RepID=UPI003F35C643